MSVLSQTRLTQVREVMAATGADALVVTHLPNIFYLSGFSGSNAILLVLGDVIHLFTDGRYTIQAHEEAPLARVHIVRTPLAEACGEFVRSRSLRRRMHVAFEAASLNVDAWARLKKGARPGIEWKPTTELIERIREVKSAEELDVMRCSARLASEVIAEASGPRSALPHARPTEKRLQKNELVVLDLGAILRHYCSDLTRTVFLGRAPARIRRWYKAVEQAQEAAQDALRAGV